MTARILDGKQLAETIRAEIAEAVRAFVQGTNRRPGLAAVLVGDNPASQVYVRNKRKACEQVGIDSWLHELPAATTQKQLLDLIDQLNADVRVSGILVQLPLPAQISEAAIIRAVDEGLEAPMAKSIDIELEQFLPTLRSEDASEGIQAFFTKREPQFKGK